MGQRSSCEMTFPSIADISSRLVALFPAAGGVALNETSIPTACEE